MMKSFLMVTRNSAVFHFFSVTFFFLLLFVVYFHTILFSDVLLMHDGAVGDYIKITKWTNNLFSGYPLINDPTFIAFYPLKIMIYKILRLDFNFYIISAYFLMAFFTYWYVYHLTQAKTSALISAIIYSFSGFAIFEVGHASLFIHTICWLPLILLAFEKLKNNFSLFWAMVALLTTPVFITAGFPQLSLAMFPVIFVYAIKVSYQSNKTLKQFCFFIAIIMGGCLIASPIIASTYLLGLSSDRSHLSWEAFCSYYVEFPQLLLFFVPYLMGGYHGIFAQTPRFGNWEIVGTRGYIGFLAFILALIGLWKCKSNLKATAYFWTFFAFLSVLVALGPQVETFYKFLYKIPVVNNFRAPERYLFIFAFAISVLAGFGLQSVQYGAIKTFIQQKIVLIGACILMCLLLGNVVMLYPSLVQAALSKSIQLPKWYINPAVIVPMLWMMAAIIGLWFALKFPKNLLCNVFLISVVCGELLYTAFFSYWHPTQAAWSKEQFFHPPTYLSFLRDNLSTSKQRYLLMKPTHVGIGKYLWGNYPLYYNLPSTGGYTPIIILDYSNFLPIGNNGAYIYPELQNNQAINIAGIKYIFTLSDDPFNANWFANKNQFKLHETIGSILVYENLHALPRAWFTHQVVSLPKSSMLNVIHTGKFDDGTPFKPANIALVEKNLALNLVADDTAIAIIIKMTNKRTVIATKTRQLQFLVLSDIYYPGWYAYIDGKKSKFYRTNYVYRGLVVPAGEHRVEFVYRPYYIDITYVIAIMTLLGFTCAFLYNYRRHEKRTYA